MTKANLQKDIAELEAALQVDGITPDEKAIYEGALQKAKDKLSKMEAKSKGNAAAASAPAKKKDLTKAEFYAAMDKKFKTDGFTLAAVKAMEQKEYDANIAEWVSHAKTLVPDSQAMDYVQDWVNKHIPKGKMPRQKKAKPEAKADAPAKAKEETPVYSWRSTAAASAVNPIVIHCQHYVQEVEQDIPVELKGPGMTSYVITAKKGEFLIFDDKYRLVYVMEPKSFARKCILNTTVEAHEKNLHRTDDVEKLESVIEALKKENAAYEEALKQQNITTAEKAEKEEPGAAPKAAKTTASKKRKNSCTDTDLDDAEVIARVMEFLEENADKFKKAWDTSTWFKNNQQEITGIYEMKGKGNEGKVLMQVKTWNATAQNKVEWYSLCIDSYKLTPVEKPKNGTYESIVSKNRLMAAYTTEGEEKYRTCARIHADLARCRAKGNCTAEQKERYGRQTARCGNLAKRYIGSRVYGAFLNAETKKRRNEGESYPAALRRTAKELREEYE